MQMLLENLLSQLREFFDPQRIGELLAEGIINLLIIVIVLIIFYILWKLIQRVFIPRIQRNMDSTNAAFAETLLKFFVLSIGILAALSAIGVQTSAVLASLGVVGLTIGFALRDTLSNIISGLLIFIDRPFTIGDLIEIDGKYGRVDRISLRTTRVVTPDGKMLAVPNAEVMNKTVNRSCRGVGAGVNFKTTAEALFFTQIVFYHLMTEGAGDPIHRSDMQGVIRVEKAISEHCLFSAIYLGLCVSHRLVAADTFILNHGF